MTCGNKITENSILLHPKQPVHRYFDFSDPFKCNCFRTKSLKTCFLSKIFRWKKFVKKFTKSWKLKKSILNAFSNISWTSWATETYLTFLERIFHNKQLCKSLNSSKTIFYSCYCLKCQFAFFLHQSIFSRVHALVNACTLEHSKKFASLQGACNIQCVYPGEHEDL